MVEDDAAVLRLLADRRHDLVAHRTRVVCRLHALVAQLREGGASIGLSADRAAELLRRIRPIGAADVERKRQCTEHVAELRRLDSQLGCLADRPAVGRVDEVDGLQVLPRSGGMPRPHAAAVRGAVDGAGGAHDPAIVHQWACVRLDAIYVDELRELLVDAWRIYRPSSDGTIRGPNLQNIRSGGVRRHETSR